MKISAEQDAELERRAREAGVSVPRLLVEAALAPVPGETPAQRMNAMTELFALHRLLAGIANNVNQIARAVNSGGTPGLDQAATLEAVRRTARRIDEAVEELSRR